LATTKLVSRIGTAMISSGAASAIVAGVFSTPSTASAPST
jgi:hypothetical protein